MGLVFQTVHLLKLTQEEKCKQQGEKMVAENSYLIHPYKYAWVW